MYYSPPDYRDYSAGKYWGVSTVLKGMKYTDVCGRKPGEWKALSINHIDGSTKPVKEQTYTDPSGKVRRVSACSSMLRYIAEYGTRRPTHISTCLFWRELVSCPILKYTFRGHDLTCLTGIMAQNRHGPWDALQVLHPIDYSAEELPDLQKSSDMMWAMWEFAVPADERQNLEMFMTLSIVNKKTLALISRAFKNMGKEISKAPTVI